MKGFSAFREHTEIDLADVDLVALVGPTGSGKSTIIDAITFALYGSVARYEDNRAVAPIINQTSAEARVSLTFELNGDEYTAARVVRRTKTGASTKEARLERGDEMLAADARSMSKKVEQLLGLDMDQFNRTVVLPQGRFADFLHDDPSKRQATLRQLLGFDVYERIGKAARSKARETQVQADLLRDDLDGAAQSLNDERRVELAGAFAAVQAVRLDYDLARTSVDELNETRLSLQGESDQAEQQLKALAGVRSPDGIAELDVQLIEARAKALETNETFKAARASRLAAKDAADAGPDRAEIQLRLQSYATFGALTGEMSTLGQRISALEADAKSATKLAAGIREEQDALDGKAGAARSRADDVQKTLEEVASVAQLDAWLDLHAVFLENKKRAEAADVAAEAANAPIAAAEEAVDVSESALRDLDARLESIRDRIGIVAYASMLAAGEECPLCLQEVHTIPDHHVDDELTDVSALRERAAITVQGNRSALEQLRNILNAALATLRSSERAAEGSAKATNAVAPVEELETQRIESERLAAEARRVNEEARAAADASASHRASEENRQVIEREQKLTNELSGIRGELSSTTQRLDALAHELSEAPSQTDCERLAEEAAKLAEALKLAEEAEKLATDQHETAIAARSETDLHLADAQRQLATARDAVAALGPPPVDGSSIAADWAELTRWVDEQRDLATRSGVDARSKRDRIDTEISGITDGLQSRLRSVIGDDSSEVDFSRAGEFLAALQSSAEAALATFDAEREKLGDLKERIATLDEQQAVAKKLGDLLRSDGFEGWLMQSALEQLAERATARLFEMSGSQYSLVLEDRSFSVRDHSNADELRSARTLSGGETFLASLSLALALAESTAELAPEGAPQIESIFLDEGFGTLDPHTLDIVASAIEELGATGRMVGIVTHIRELADRMPVRLEVTKTSGSASVERVDV